MPVSISSAMLAQGQGWRRFFLLLGLFWFACFLGSNIRTPGSWSDVRSQWLGAAVIAVLSLIFLIVSARIYWSRGQLTGFQAALLALIFGVVFVLMARELFVSTIFLQEVRSHAFGTETPNEAHALDAAITLCLPCASLLRRASDARR